MSINYQDLVKRLKDAKNLLDLFALFEQYKAVFLNAPMLCFLDLEAGEFKDSLHDFSFLKLEEAIAQFHHILNAEKQKQAFQPPEPFSYEKHIQKPQKLHDVWVFSADLSGVISLNRLYTESLKLGNEVLQELLILKLLKNHNVLTFENHHEADTRFNEVVVTFHSVWQAKDFIERLNKFVDNWVTVDSLNYLLEMLHITNLVGDPYSIEDEDLDDYDMLDTLADDITRTIELTNRPSLHSIELYNVDDSHILKFPFDIREFWWRVRQLKIIGDDFDLAGYLGLQHTVIDQLTDAIQERIDPRLNSRVLIQGEAIGRHIRFYINNESFGDPLYFPFSIEAFEQAIEQVNQLASKKPCKRP